MAEINKLVVPISDGQGGYTPTEITFEGSGGSGLPNEVITYEQFRAKTDEQQAAYTGYITGWPNSENGETIRYNEETDYIQVMFNGSWSNCYYAGMKLDPTKMELTQAEFIAICNQGLQSMMSLNAIITLNNQYWNKFRVIGINHDGTTGTVDIMSDRQAYANAFGSNNNYQNSTVRNWLNDNYYNAFDYDIRNLMKTMAVQTTGRATLNDKVKILSCKEIGITATQYYDSTELGSKYPVFTEGYHNTAVNGRWVEVGNYGNSSYYVLRTKGAADYSSSCWYVTNQNKATPMTTYTTNYGYVPVLRF